MIDYILADTKRTDRRILLAVTEQMDHPFLTNENETNRSFVKMYVNERTIDFGDDGRAAVRLFLSEGKKIGMVDPNFDIEGIEFIGYDE